MAEGGVLTEEYRRFLDQPSSNMDDSGFFSGKNVVVAAAVDVDVIAVADAVDVDVIAVADVVIVEAMERFLSPKGFSLLYQCNGTFAFGP